MITDKDMEDARQIERKCNHEAGWGCPEGMNLDELAIEINRIRSESAEQARKEAAISAKENVCASCDDMCIGDCDKIKAIIDSILGNSVIKESLNTEKKLDIAIKALQIASDFCGSLTADECPDYVAVPINDALKELKK